jgi:hypothetical protein
MPHFIPPASVSQNIASTSSKTICKHTNDNKWII